MVRRIPALEKSNFKIRYSQVEDVGRVEDIHHRSVRACLQYLKWTEPLTITHDGDLPARSGIGSSSTFTVGLLQSLYALRGIRLSSGDLSRRAIYVEREVAKECVGYQDQIAAAVGGLNYISFIRGGPVRVKSMTVPKETLHSLSAHCLLLYTGTHRDGPSLEKKKVSDMASNGPILRRLQSMVPEGYQALKRRNWEDFGYLLNEAWSLKRSLNKGVSTSAIDNLYGLARKHGAWGGKVLGSGGGGFLLLFGPPNHHNNILSSLPLSIQRVPFHFSQDGSQIIYRRSE